MSILGLPGLQGTMSLTLHLRRISLTFANQVDALQTALVSFSSAFPRLRHKFLHMRQQKGSSILCSSKQVLSECMDWLG